MNFFSTEVCVIGAGPGGAAAALQLDKLGISCLVADRARFPRDKVCGDALSGKVVVTLNRIDPGILEHFEPTGQALPSFGVQFVAPNGKSLRVPFKKNYSKSDKAPGYISRRMSFDDHLVQQLRKRQGIRLLEETAITGFRYEDGYWLLTDDKQELTIKTRLVLAADGAQSAFARQSGLVPVEPGHYCAGIRGYYSGVQGLDPDGFIELHFLKEFLPGYFWIFPLPNGLANVGVGMRSDAVSKKKVHLKKAMEQLLLTHPALRDRFRHARLEGDIKGYGLPLGSKKRSLSGNGFMLVGDAGSLIDPFTGEGIGNAVISGVKAAETAAAALRAGNFSHDFLRQYDESVYKRLWNELSLSYRMQQLVKYPWLFNMVVNKSQKSKTLQDLIMSMFEDLELRNLLRSPSFYFRLLFTNR